ncbi:Ubiquitin carboxyl-terminal hydrolase 8 [Glycine soja]
MGNDADSNSGTEDDIHSSTNFEFYLQGLERAKIIVNKPLPQRMQESVSIYKCLEAFLKEEPLGPEDHQILFFFFFTLNLLKKRLETLTEAQKQALLEEVEEENSH